MALSILGVCIEHTGLCNAQPGPKYYACETPGVSGTLR